VDERSIRRASGAAATQPPQPAHIPAPKTLCSVADGGAGAPADVEGGHTPPEESVVDQIINKSGWKSIRNDSAQAAGFLCPGSAVTKVKS